MVAIRKIGILAAVLLALGVEPAAAAVFAGSTYDGATFASGAGPFTWSFESSYDKGEFSGVAYRLSTDGVWNRCRENWAGTYENPRSAPVVVSLSNLGYGAYTIEITNDQSKAWLIAEGISNSGLNTCPNKEYPGYGAVSRDSFTIAAPVVPGKPGEPSLPGATTTSPTTTPGPSTPTPSTTPASRCRAGYTTARIGGHSACLHAGGSCVWRFRRQYRHYHYACVRHGRKYRLARR
jgi:hypothetical protein